MKGVCFGRGKDRAPLLMLAGDGVQDWVPPNGGHTHGCLPWFREPLAREHSGTPPASFPELCFYVLVCFPVPFLSEAFGISSKMTPWHMTSLRITLGGCRRSGNPQRLREALFPCCLSHDASVTVRTWIILLAPLWIIRWFPRDCGGPPTHEETGGFTVSTSALPTNPVWVLETSEEEQTRRNGSVCVACASFHGRTITHSCVSAGRAPYSYPLAKWDPHLLPDRGGISKDFRAVE